MKTHFLIIFEIIILIFFILFIVWYLYQTFFVFLFKGFDNPQKRNKLYNNTFNGKFKTSVNIGKIIPGSIYKKTRWYKHVGEGWFNFIAAINNNNNYDFWLVDVKNVLAFIKNTLPTPILFSMLIINVKNKKIFEKFKIRFEKILNDQTFISEKNKKIKPSIEILDGWIFIVFPKLLNLESIKTINKIIYELNTEEFI